MDVIFFILFLLFLPLIEVLLRFSGLSFFRFSIPSFVIMVFIVFSYLGIFPLYYYLDEYRFNIGVVDRDIILTMLCFSAWCILSMSLGFVFSRRVVGVSHSSIVETRGFYKLERIGVLVMVIFCGLVFLKYLSHFKHIALFEVFTDGPLENLKRFRSEMGNSFVGKYHWYAAFMSDALIFLSFASFSNALKKTDLMSLFLFLMTFSICVVSALIATEKAPVVWYLIGLYLVFVLTLREGNYPMFKSAFFASVIVGILVSTYTFFMGVGSVADALISLSSRTFTGQIFPAYFYIQNFADNPVWGRTFPNPGGIFSFEPYRISIEVMYMIFPKMIGKEVVGSAPTVFWADLFANFGTWAVVCVPFFVGFFLYLFSSWVSSKIKTSLEIGLIVWLAIHYKNLAFTSIGGFVMDFYLAIVIIVYLLVTCLRQVDLKGTPK